MTAAKVISAHQGVIEIHPPEPKRKPAAVQDEQLAYCRNPGTTALGWPCPAARAQEPCPCRCRQGNAVSLELCQLQPRLRWQRQGWVCVCVCSCSIGQDMLMGNRNNSNCLVVGETLTTLWLGACNSPASETTAGEIMGFFPFLFFIRTQEFSSSLYQGQQYFSVSTGARVSQHFLSAKEEGQYIVSFSNVLVTRSTSCPFRPWAGRSAGVSLAGHQRLSGVCCPPFPADACKASTLQMSPFGEREAVRAGASLFFFFLWEVAEHILDNHFMLLGSGA